MKISEYSSDIHKHILACWGAASAASQSTFFKFSVEHGKQLILLAKDGQLSSESSFVTFIKSIENFTSQEQFDEWHRGAIENMLCGSDIGKVFNKINLEKPRRSSKLDRRYYSYGIAAKLLNCYLKVFYISSFGNTQYGKYIHPPVDAILLKKLFEVEPDLFKFQFKASSMYHDGSIPKWTTLDGEEYETVIERISSFIRKHDANGLWKIEFAWMGHQ